MFHLTRGLYMRLNWLRSANNLVSFWPALFLHFLHLDKLEEMKIEAKMIFEKGYEAKRSIFSFCFQDFYGATIYIYIYIWDFGNGRR